MFPNSTWIGVIQGVSYPQYSELCLINLPPLVGHPQELAGTGALREAAQQPLGQRG